MIEKVGGSDVASGFFFRELPAGDLFEEHKFTFKIVLQTMVLDWILVSGQFLVFVDSGDEYCDFVIESLASVY